MDKNLLIFIGDDFVSTLFLNEFIPQLIEMGVKPIILSVVNNHDDKNSPHELQRYDFYQKDLLQNVLLPFLENNGEKHFKLSTPQQIFDHYNLQVIETTNVNDETILNQIKKLNFIGAISVRCFQIFGSKIISEIKNKGFFCNSHPGVLPDYRGVYCLLRGLVNGDEKLGWTLHDIDTGIDTGNVIKEIPFYNFNKGQTIIEILASTVPSLSDAWLDFIQQTLDNETITKVEQNQDGNYYTYPTQYEFENWYETNALCPLIAKKMVKFYFDLFVPQENKFKQSAQDFKVTMINKVAQFETLMEIEKPEASYETPQKTAA